MSRNKLSCRNRSRKQVFGATRRIAFLAGAAVVGRGHEQNGIPCQDYVCHESYRGIGAIVLADGAGSASHAEAGAKIVATCVARFLTRNLRELVASEEANARLMILNVARQALVEQADQLQIDLRELASTLLFAVSDNKVMLTGQLGDGRIGIRAKYLPVWRVIDTAYKGEFSNTTVFITSPNAEQYLKLALIPVKDVSGCVLMSDGAESCLYQRATEKFAPAVETMYAWSNLERPASVEAALADNLTNIIRMRTQDDVSLGYLMPR